MHVGAFWSTTAHESRAQKKSILCSRYIFIKRGYNEAMNPRRNTASSMSCRGRKPIRMNSLACVSLPAVCIPSDTPHSRRAIAQSFTFLLLLLDCCSGTQFSSRATGGAHICRYSMLLRGKKDRLKKKSLHTYHTVRLHYACMQRAGKCVNTTLETTNQNKEPLLIV